MSDGDSYRNEQGRETCRGGCCLKYVYLGKHLWHLHRDLKEVRKWATCPGVEHLQHMQRPHQRWAWLLWGIAKRSEVSVAKIQWTIGKCWQMTLAEEVGVRVGVKVEACNFSHLFWMRWKAVGVVTISDLGWEGALHCGDPSTVRGLFEWSGKDIDDETLC